MMLDLFSGTGGASAAFREAGWFVVTFDNDAVHRPHVCVDLATYDFRKWREARPDFVWASPPCTEFSRERMPWCRTGRAPSLDLVTAAARAVEVLAPRYWVVENVRGAVPYLDLIFGRFKARCGPFFLWGSIPEFRLYVPPFKERLSSKRKAERAAVPIEVSRKVLEVVSA